MLEFALWVVCSCICGWLVIGCWLHWLRFAGWVGWFWWCLLWWFDDGVLVLIVLFCGLVGFDIWVCGCC